MQPQSITKFAKPAATQACLSVVVVNFRGREHTMSLVRQLDASDLFRSGAAEVIIVDNDADSEQLKTWARKRHGVRVRGLGRNRGFSRAVNEGARLANGSWLLVLNPDVSVPEEFLDQALALVEERLAQDPAVGIIGLGLQNADRTQQPSAGPFPTLMNVVTGLARSRAERRCRPTSSQAGVVPWVTGCCMLIRQECWETLNGFDEDFFLYYEDVDLCRRAQAAGWTVWHDPTLVVTHHHPLHSRVVRPPLRVITRHALLTYACKHWRPWQVRALSRLVGFEARCRGWWAWRQGCRLSAGLYRELAHLARDLQVGRVIRARQRLVRTAALLADEPLS